MGKLGPVLRLRLLTFEIEEPASVGRMGLDECQRRSMIDELALAREFARKIPLDWRTNAADLRVDERGRGNAIGDVRGKGPDTHSDKQDAPLPRARPVH